MCQDCSKHFTYRQSSPCMTVQDQDCKNDQARGNHADWLKGTSDYSMTFKNSRQNVKSPSLFMLLSWASISFSGSNLESLKQRQCQQAYGQLFLLSLHLGLTWTSLLPLLPLFISLLHFYLCSPIPFGLSISGKRHMNLWPGDKVVTQPHDLLSVCEMNNRYTVTNCQETLEEMTWLVNNHDMHLLLTCWFMDLSVSREVCTLYNYSSHTVVTEVWAVLLETGILQLNHGNWN